MPSDTDWGMLSVMTCIVIALAINNCGVIEERNACLYELQDTRLEEQQQ